MKLIEYPGLVPMNVSRDAKYSVVHGKDGYEVRLIYRINSREQFLLTTSDHPTLVEEVNAVKEKVSNRLGGVFYINEFRDVIVKAGDKAYYACNYEKDLVFDLGNGKTVGPRAPDGLRSGETWPGPHAGVKYVLAAGGEDVRYKIKSGRSERTVLLSDDVGEAAAKRLAQRLATVKGDSGGGVYVNEAAEFFGPPSGGGGEHLYLGSLGEDQWFDPPDVPRP